MTTLLVGTDQEATSHRLCDYLEDRIETVETLHVVNSLKGGNDDAKVAAGQAALDVFTDRFGDRIAVETHQYTRGNDATADLLTAAREFDVAEVVLGIDQKRTQVNKLIFGSVAQAVLLQTDRPVVGVPLPPED
ncbi:universal stress protein [Haloarchaeobius amylolyticus]|uniref:universal stress protein n=1 Tax=Haloarchaeobius amylolyticus TaxID=1198296 RepID=UPI0022705592|nr:universal stress protein [Haloarchaeobius amylolyticus]